MAITRELLRSLREDIDSAIFDVAKRHGVALRVGNASFSGNTAKFALEVVLLSGSEATDDVVELRARESWKQACEMFMMKPEWLDQVFTSNGKTYKVAGLMPSRRKFPVLARKTDGKLILLTCQAVLHGFSTKTKEG